MSCTNCSYRHPDLTKNNDIQNLITTKSSFDWLEDTPDTLEPDLVEVRFKGNRKEFYKNIHKIPLSYNQMVTVQTPGGFDVGVVNLKGNLAMRQYLRKNQGKEPEEFKIIYRRASENDLKTWKEAKELEKRTLVQSREIAMQLGLTMKISDVEYQGDKRKATFYYIAENRVDFRELIKKLAIQFQVKIEMRQIGARQEAAKVGGIGSCGKELCCSSWRTTLPSVSSNAMQIQQLTPGSEKYMGQCGKLKCCLMYELATYLDSKADFPKELLELETKKGIAHPYKVDILKKTVWYSYKTDISPESPVEISLDKVKEIINLNKRGIKADNLDNFALNKPA